MNNKAKRIGLITAYVVIALVVIAIISMTFLPKSYKPGIANPSKSAVSIELASNPSQSRAVPDEKFNEFVDIYNKSFNETILKSLFAGRLNNSVKVKALSQEPTSFSGYKIIMAFDTLNPQKLNEKSFTRPNGDMVEYDRIIFSATETDNLQQVTIYLRTVDFGSPYLSLTTYANFAELYKLAEDIISNN